MKHNPGNSFHFSITNQESTWEDGINVSLILGCWTYFIRLIHILLYRVNLFRADLKDFVVLVFSILSFFFTTFLIPRCYLTTFFLAKLTVFLVTLHPIFI